MYLVRYEEIKLEDAVEILRKNNGWLDGDSRCVVCLSRDELLFNIGCKK